jgi:16S rRNA (guanine966-N2)-methyltransferase
MSLRITGNRAIKTLPGLATRPTPAKVRQALFNIWQQRLPGCVWLDLCSGSGAMGAEALCRGAAVVIGIEQSGPACRLIAQNWQQIAEAQQRFQVIRGEVCKTLLHLPKPLPASMFDCIYFDPPYASDLYVPVLQAIVRQQILKPTGELAVEFNPTQPPAWAQTGLGLRRVKTYGNTALGFLGLDG